LLRFQKETNEAVDSMNSFIRFRYYMATKFREHVIEEKWFHQILLLQPLVNCYANYHKNYIADFLRYHVEWIPSQLACGKGSQSCETRYAADQANEKAHEVETYL
jgi:trehalose utilization protein